MGDVFAELLPSEHRAAFLALLATPLVGGMLIAGSTTHSVDTWYRFLEKPWYTPHKAAFGPIWTVLYVAMGYASFVVYRETGASLTAPLVWYAAQLLLNWAWSLIFFRWKRMGLALAEMTLMAACAWKTAWEFYKIDKLAGYLLAPYLSFLFVATAVNWGVMRLNPDPIAVVNAKAK